MPWMRSVPMPAFVAVAVVSLLALSACADQDRESAPRPSAVPRSSTTVLPARSAPSPGPSGRPLPTASAPADPVVAEAGVRDAWEGFFAPESSVEDRTGLVENGEQYGLMVEAFATDPRASALRSRVDSVEFTDGLRATVVYALVSGGQAVAADLTGTAVLQDQIWRISFATLCSLAEYGEDVPRAATCRSAVSPAPSAVR
ncbi:hypothetical protein [Streptomyces sp. NPDC059166]|uniref:hypothetical protein n=1 Tax=Streptomyces sp. NPDC059166 TaxID=3346752 RepID=UPI0036AFA9E5